MKAHVAKSVIGYFAFDDNQKLLFYNLFKLSEEKIVKRLQEDIDDEFLKQLKGFEIVEDKFARRIMRKNLREFALTLGFSNNEKEFNEFVSGIGLFLSREKLKNIIIKDSVIVQVSNTLESLNKALNIFTEHFKEWFWLHYPEYKGENEKIINNVSKYGLRENFPDFNGSYGIKFDESDEKVIREFANQLSSLLKLKKDMENYVKGMISKVAPNFSCLIDELTAARMLALAGSLEKLAKMPTSTIQLLGAERALFRHLKNRRVKPPKFGILYETGYVRNAPQDKKGKVARIVASKLSMAAKLDFYTRRDEREKLKKEMEEEIKNIFKR